MLRYALAAGIVVGLVGCNERPQAGTVDSTPTAQRRAVAATDGSSAPPAPGVAAPGYLQPIFRALDTLLSAGQRDTLRALTLDSGFVYRTRQLAPAVNRMSALWSRSPAGDTLRAHGEDLPGVMVVILIDLYQQHLRGEGVNLAGALHRMSSEYVSSYGRVTVSVDSLLLQQDVDDSGRPDRLVRELRTKAIDAEPGVADRRLALYLDAPLSASRRPAWTTPWDEGSEGTLDRTLSVSGGGSLLVVVLAHADSHEGLVLSARHGEVRELLRQQIDYGEGSFSVREEGERIVVTATGQLRIEGRPLSPRIQCKPQEWPGSSLVFDSENRRFVAERSLCVPRR